MGKGGEQNSKKGETTQSARKFKLQHMADEELRKWAKAYNVNADLEREKLLAELNPFADGILDPSRPANLPLDPPPFTLDQIIKAIPPHCFQRSLLTSLSHLAWDLTLVAIFAYLATWIDSPSLPSWSPYLLWPLYWYAMGCVLTGIWVLAHECGHQAFSESEWINNTFGTLLHSLLLVPYHSWRITHARHHNNTGSCENDEVFAPSTRSDWLQQGMLRETPLAHLSGIVIMLTVGWMPGYLVFNATGPAKYRGQNANHFSPTAAFFKPEDYWLVVQSDVAFFSALAALTYAAGRYGMLTVGKYYLLPYLVVNLHLVLITFLQHTDVYLPHFRGKEWSWLRGALCTVDRSYGVLLDGAFHRITDTHVCHHLFSKMPFYHAAEATDAFRAVLGKYYLRDDTPILHALWRAYATCQFVEDHGDTVFYKNEL